MVLTIWICKHKETEKRNSETVYQLDFGAVIKKCPDCGKRMIEKRFVIIE